ncbi:MAG: glycosyltransferase family 2 protein [Deltaproteobacteria bacterium]|nr:glycosyltransferase family 2 protein [Deltaproteobacteria bacterium]
MRTAAIIPAFQAQDTIGEVVAALVAQWPGSDERGNVIVVDDGSTDDTAERARQAGALVVCHGRNQGKGAALRTGLRVARDLEFDIAVAVDADGQHPSEEARRLADFPCDPRALVLGVRDLQGAGAPRANQISNRISNFFLSVFTGRVLADTQCGLRRYPVRETLALDARDPGYGFEAEVLLLAVRAHLPVIEVPIHVVYPSRGTHFRVVRDPARIVARVLYTLGRRPPGLIRMPEAHPFPDGFPAPSRRGAQ